MLRICCTGNRPQHFRILKTDFYIIGNFRCPVTFRVFTPTSHIVTICQTGNVYSLEAIEELNLKPGHLRDLLTDEPFQRKDIVTLQVRQFSY